MEWIYSLIAIMLTLTSGTIADILHEDTKQEEKIDNVQNVIDNMISGAITPNEAHKFLFDLKYWTKQNSIDDNGVEAEVNRAYIDYINSALDVINIYNNYGNNSTEFNLTYEIMQEKKNLI